MEQHAVAIPVPAGRQSVSHAETPTPVRGARTGSAQPEIARLLSAVADAVPHLAEACQAFWGVPVHLKLFTVSDRPLYFWRLDNFYVSQAGQHIHLRLSDTACSTLLTQVLGDRELPTAFSFSSLTGLEATLLTAFSRDMLGVLAKSLINPKALAPKAPDAQPTSKPKTEQNSMMHLIWTLMPTASEELPINTGQPLRFREAREVGKLILSLPADTLRPDLLESARQTAFSTIIVKDDFFDAAPVETRLVIGQGRVPVAGLESMEPGDLVVLEESSIEQLWLMEPESYTLFPFGIQFQDSPQLHVPLTQDMDAMTPTDAQARQALLDNLMIDVGAEFLPVKMPLKQLKQMSEGLVVEIGDLLHNEVALTVEGKALARGELVIVGDQFGVRITQVLAEHEDVGQMPAQDVNLPVQDNTTVDAQPAPLPQQSGAPQQVVPQQQSAPPQAPTQPAQAQQPPPPSDDLFGDDFDDDDDW